VECACIFPRSSDRAEARLRPDTCPCPRRCPRAPASVYSAAVQYGPDEIPLDTRSPGASATSAGSAHAAILKLAEAFLRSQRKDSVTDAAELAIGAVRIVFRLAFLEHGNELGWWELAEPRTWESTRAAFRQLAASTRRAPPELPGLGRLPFGDAGELETASLSDEALHAVLDSLRAARGQGGKQTVGPVLWGLDLGSAYETLLLYEPRIDEGRLVLESTRSHVRRSTGSYYTPPSLIDKVLDRALDPLIETACSKKDPERSLLALRICDPACGSGAFLVAAARRMASRLASTRASAGGRADRDPLLAARDVIGTCLHGVDVDPIAIECCRIALWLEAGGRETPLTLLEDKLECADALVGATPERLRSGIPASAFRPVGDDDASAAKSWKQDCRLRAQLELPKVDRGAGRMGREEADAWCAAFLSRKQQGASCAEALVDASRKRRFLHWHLRYPRIFTVPGKNARASNPFTGWNGGFHLVIGNPPWIAHSGRAAQPLEPHVRNYFDVCEPAFAGYKTTHGLFVHLGARLLRPGGRLGMIVPTSVADLEGYRPARRAHDRLCQAERSLPDFGDVFEGVFQPCMALISIRREGQLEDPPADAWDLERKDLQGPEHELLGRLGQLAPLPASLFGERGLQTTAQLRQSIRELDGPQPPFEVALREGADIQEWTTKSARLFGDASAIGKSLRAAEQWSEVALLIRQTARWPIASASDGLAFRNSLLAGFEREDWKRGELLLLLNSSLIRWLHYHRFRDARQGMPQVKIGHLRSIPAPSRLTDEERLRWRAEGDRLIARNKGILPEERASVDAWVFEAYALSADEIRIVRAWAASQGMGTV